MLTFECRGCEELLETNLDKLINTMPEIPAICKNCGTEHILYHKNNKLMVIIK